MTKKNIDEVIRLTQECLTRYWQLDIDYIISLCDEDVVWIGALQSEFTMGKDAFIEDLTAVKKELKPCHLVSQEYVVAQNAGTACTIAGRYLVTTDETVEYFLQAAEVYIYLGNGGRRPKDQAASCVEPHWRTRSKKR